MIKALAYCAALAAVLPVTTAAAPARVVTAVDEVAVKTEVAIDSLTVGQRFHVRYHFTFADSLKPVVPKNLDAGTCRAMDVAWTETAKDHAVERTGDVTFIPMSVDSSIVPANKFDFVSPAGDTIRAWSDDIPVPIRRIAMKSQDLRPLKEQWQAPLNWWLWGGIAAAVLIGLAVLIWWLRGRRRRGEAIAPEVRLPPEVIALAELDRVAAMGLAQRGEFKTHYTLVVDALRRYLEARYRIETMDRTTWEIIDALDRREVRIGGLRAVLDEADLVKFAKFTPTADSANAAIGHAREIVIATTPVAVAETDPLAPSRASTGAQA